ncbi:unnamed protein product [Onchocerca ochengi]|uniref:Dickkopf_N domain-containing protein n=1 Tax=Onchocerca ochengi TaxID=42157 RepID=A0A182EEY5_ONCOC|nr:unnamed protein product [Onchocerca ochengi]
MDCKLILPFYILLANLEANAFHLSGYRSRSYLQGIQPYDIQPLDVQPQVIRVQTLKSQDIQPYSIQSRSFQLGDLELQDVQLQGEDQPCEGCKITISCGSKNCKSKKLPYVYKPIFKLLSTRSTKKPVFTLPTQPPAQWDCPCPCHVPQRCRMCSACHESYI